MSEWPHKPDPKAPEWVKTPAELSWPKLETNRTPEANPTMELDPDEVAAYDAGEGGRIVARMPHQRGEFESEEVVNIERARVEAVTRGLKARAQELELRGHSVDYVLEAVKEELALLLAKENFSNAAREQLAALVSSPKDLDIGGEDDRDFAKRAAADR